MRPAGRLYPVVMAGRCRASGHRCVGGTGANSTPAKVRELPFNAKLPELGSSGAQRLAVMIALAPSSPLRSSRCLRFAVRFGKRSGLD